MKLNNRWVQLGASLVAMIMFVLSSHEFAASSLLVGPETAVASTLLYDEWDTGTYPGVAVIALFMVALAFVD